jgi:hypothetical protein
MRNSSPDLVLLLYKGPLQTKGADHISFDQETKKGLSSDNGTQMNKVGLNEKKETKQ